VEGSNKATPAVFNSTDNNNRKHQGVADDNRNNSKSPKTPSLLTSASQESFSCKLCGTPRHIRLVPAALTAPQRRKCGAYRSRPSVKVGLRFQDWTGKCFPTAVDLWPLRSPGVGSPVESPDRYYLLIMMREVRCLRHADEQHPGGTTGITEEDLAHVVVNAKNLVTYRSKCTTASEPIRPPEPMMRIVFNDIIENLPFELESGVYDSVQELQAKPLHPWCCRRWCDCAERARLIVLNSPIHAFRSEVRDFKTRCGLAAEPGR
jgi:hypothetical protein